MENKYKITGISHIGMPTNDIEMTKKFYQSLGFEVIMETYNEKAKEKVAFLQLGNYCIETFENHQAVMTDGIETLPFWKNGVKFFMIFGPNKERIEFC